MKNWRSRGWLLAILALLLSAAAAMGAAVLLRGGLDGRAAGALEQGLCSYGIADAPRLENAELLVPPFIDVMRLHQWFPIVLKVPEGVEVQVRGVYLLDATGYNCTVDWRINTTGLHKGYQFYVIDVRLVRGFLAPLRPALLVVDAGSGLVSANLSVLGPLSPEEAGDAVTIETRSNRIVVKLKPGNGELMRVAVPNCGIQVEAEGDAAVVALPSKCGGRLTLVVVIDTEERGRLVLYTPVSVPVSG